MIADLAFWLHEKYPGGAAPLKECRDRLLDNLTKDEGYEPLRAQAIADGLLSFASCEAGLLCERGLGQYGFFHLTFEEYLAGYHLTRTGAGGAPRHPGGALAGQPVAGGDPTGGRAVGRGGQPALRCGRFLNDLRQMESSDPADAGRPTVLAGRALADIGASGVNPPSVAT